CDRSFNADGQLVYEVSPDPKAPWVPEFFGDAYMVNGKLFPYLDVEARKYRFRLLNACNGRFLHLAFANEMGFHQIGTDQGLLPAPVALKNLVLGPGERADLVVDFAGHRGEKIVLANDSFNVMQFRVAAKASQAADALPAQLRPVPAIPET